MWRNTVEFPCGNISIMYAVRPSSIGAKYGTRRASPRLEAI
jgi:hypothetical protein